MALSAYCSLGKFDAATGLLSRRGAIGRFVLRSDVEYQGAECGVHLYSHYLLVAGRYWHLRSHPFRARQFQFHCLGRHIEQLKGRHGSEIAQVRLELGKTLMLLDQSDLAREQLEEAIGFLETRQHSGGSRGVDAWFLLGDICRNLGRHADAIRAYNNVRALARTGRRRYGEQSNAWSAEAHIRLGQVALLQEGQTAVAIESFREAERRLELASGLRLLLKADAYSGLGDARSRNQEFAEALKMHEKALAVVEDAWGKQNPLLATYINRLADAFDAQKQFRVSIEMRVRALELLHKKYRGAHPDVADTLYARAASLLEVQEYQKANDDLILVISYRSQLLGKDHRLVAEAYYLQGKSYDGLSNHHAAWKAYATAHKIAKQSAALGENHPTTKTYQHHMDAAGRAGQGVAAAAAGASNTGC